ncbi:MAG: peptidase [Subtercola sp.]|nr:peptidase [Subtercola sp.]
MPPLDLVPLAGSERPPQQGFAAAAQSVAPASVVDATVVLRRANAAPAGDAVGEAAGLAAGDAVSGVAGDAAGLAAGAAAAGLGAASADVELVVSTFRELGLDILEVDAPSRRVRVSGTVATVERVFGTTLQVAGASKGAGGVGGDSGAAGGPAGSAGGGGLVQNRRRSGGLSIPAALDGVVTAVLGLDDRPQARAQFRLAEAQAATASYTPVELGRIYDFPAETSGAGQTVAIVELGGGFTQSDLDTYFGGLGIDVPAVRAVGVDGAANTPEHNAQGADGEVLLDIEVVGALAPKASILVYFAPNTDAGFLDAVATAAHAKPTPAAISISWGQSEDQWTAQARTALDDALHDAAALGVTVTVAAGDNGSSDGDSAGTNHADFPASSPHALACGGTSLHATGSTVTSETVWNNGSGKGATGGGVSDVFALPTWQKAAGVPASSARGGGRGVPDVAANADPQTGYEVLVDGTRAVYGGTSAVAPLWAALVARFVEALGSPLGLLQPSLYAAAAAGAGLRDVTVGDNGAFDARVGWDACTGLGVPSGTALLAALRASQTRGVAGAAATPPEDAAPDLADELRSIRAIGENR